MRDENEPTEADSQALAHRFLILRLTDQLPFSKEDFRVASGWSEASFKTYWSKYLKPLVKKAGAGKHRVGGAFERYRSLKRFREYMSQVRGETAHYGRREYDALVTYEFYLPLAHETTLRSALDALFYDDIVSPTINRIDASDLQRLFPATTLVGDDDPYARARRFVDDKFRGYSVYHVSGRFRAAELCSRSGASQLSQDSEPYLIDETTAVVRFIFPCGDEFEAESLRFLFRELFVSRIIELISGEDEIWMIEGGLRSRVHVWSKAVD